MPQTIALQRGVTTLNTNGTTVGTLFTQSGGLATRVIVNNLGITFAQLPQGQVRIAVYVNSFGGQSTLLGYLNTPSGPKRSYQFPPGGSSSNPFNGFFNSGSNVYIYSVPAIVSNNNTTGIGSGIPNNIIFEYPSSSNQVISLIANNFYIGPNDSVTMRVEAVVPSGKLLVSTTASISYSFTTITET